MFLSREKSKVLDPYKKEYIRVSKEEGKALQKAVDVCEKCDNTKIYSSVYNKCVKRDSPEGKRLSKYIDFCVKYNLEIIKFNVEDKIIIDNLMSFKFKKKNGEVIAFKDLVNKETSDLKKLKNYDSNNIVHKKIAPIAMAMIKGMDRNPEIKDKIRLKVINGLKGSSSKLSKFLKGLGLELSSGIIFTAIAVLSDTAILSKIISGVSSFFSGVRSNLLGEKRSRKSSTPTPPVAGKPLVNVRVDAPTQAYLLENKYIDNKGKVDLAKLGIKYPISIAGGKLSLSRKIGREVLQTNIQYNSKTGTLIMNDNLKEDFSWVDIPINKDRRRISSQKRKINQEMKKLLETRTKLKSLTDKYSKFLELTNRKINKGLKLETINTENNLDKYITTKNEINEIDRKIRDFNIQGEAPDESGLNSILEIQFKINTDIVNIENEISKMNEENSNLVFRPVLTRIKYHTDIMNNLKSIKRKSSTKYKSLLKDFGQTQQFSISNAEKPRERFDSSKKYNDYQYNNNSNWFGSNNNASWSDSDFIDHQRMKPVTRGFGVDNSTGIYGNTPGYGIRHNNAYGNGLSSGNNNANRRW
jgi:hypothetical protein